MGCEGLQAITPAVGLTVFEGPSTVVVVQVADDNVKP